MTAPYFETIAFVGGGNMATALIGGLLRVSGAHLKILVVEPSVTQQQRLAQQFGEALRFATPAELSLAQLVVWAVKPQSLREAAQEVAPFTQQALHLSVAAGIPCEALARWLQTERVVRAMPNTPALIQKGMTGLFAPEAVSSADRAWVDLVITPLGEYLWVDQESAMDAVTALSGSGPAYVFYVLEAMIQAGQEMGLSAKVAHTLAVQTLLGAAELARVAEEPPEVLRERVTSKGGTTHAAVTSLEQQGVRQAFVQAIHAAQTRAEEMAQELAQS